jgi:uncharacterized protein YacL
MLNPDFKEFIQLLMPDAIILASAWECAAVLITNDKQLSKISEVQVISLPTKS